ncbi:hypothetical protein [Microbacterium deminutum]|uniref:Uncharacterized protein n=1 Tax=Microbacterium deminutum TaxID=344164 RepID=A0ABN2R596_9MICO
MSAFQFDRGSDFAGLCPVCGEELEWAPAWGQGHIAIVAVCRDHGIVDQYDALD